MFFRLLDWILYRKYYKDNVIGNYLSIVGIWIVRGDYIDYYKLIIIIILRR